MEAPVDCRDIQQYLPFLGDDSIPNEIEQEVIKHFADCDSCRTEYERIRHTLALVHTAYSETPAFDLFDGVRAGIAHHTRELRFYRYVFSAAAVLLLAVSVYFTTEMQNNRYRYDVAEPGADSAEYYEYLANHYLTTYDLLAVSDEMPISDEFDLNSELALEAGYVDLSVHDIIENMGADQLGDILQDMYY
jgi:nucleoid-associated protein YejK